MDNKYVLAMYDVWAKQDFIFRTNKIKEIVGGSLIIRDIFDDYLYKAAKDYRNSLHKSDKDTELEAIYNYEKPNSSSIVEFSVENFKKRMSESQYVGEVVYNGGGNFFILYKDEVTFKGVNKIFTKEILEKIGTLNIVCACVEVSDEHLTDYKKDSENLRRKHEALKNSESIVRAVNGIPFVQVDRNTSMPLVKYEVTSGCKDHPLACEKVSLENEAKYKKYKAVSKKNEAEYGEKALDSLVKEKGEDSLLAVVFIDGNNMGEQVRDLFSKGQNGKEIDIDYETRINMLREFSYEIHENYVEKRLKAIEKMLENKRNNDKSVKDKENSSHRKIVFAGDEMSFIVRAEDALDAVEAYFNGCDGIEGLNADNKGRSSCAGIAIFHCHDPYAQAYRIAEECCQNAKKYMRGQNISDNTASYMDFQYCKSSIGMSLDSLRERDRGTLLSKKPWLIYGGESSETKPDVFTIDMVEKVAKDLNRIGGRTNVKALIQAAEKSLTDFNLEMDRIFAHQPKDNQCRIKYTFSCLGKEKERRRLVYDVASVYDFWFRQNEEKEVNEKEGENCEKNEKR